MTKLAAVATTIGSEVSVNAVVLTTPKKSPYQFFVRETHKSAVARIVREIMPEAKVTTARNPKTELVFFENHPYKGWLGFNLPGVFETRKKIAGALFRQGWKSGVAVELDRGGLRIITNKYDHTGCIERPENTGGCAGCLNKVYDNCIGCPDNYTYKMGRKVWKRAFNKHTGHK